MLFSIQTNYEIDFVYMENDRLISTFYHFFYHLKWHHYVAFYILFLINLYTFTLVQEIERVSRAWIHFGLIFTYQPSHHFYPNFSNLIHSFLFVWFAPFHLPSLHSREEEAISFWRWLYFISETKSTIFVSYFFLFSPKYLFSSFLPTHKAYHQRNLSYTIASRNPKKGILQ